MTTQLLLAADTHFAWLLGEAVAPADLRVAPGGVDTPDVLRLLRRMRGQLAAAGRNASWLLVSDGEVVGLCIHKRPPSKSGAVEIGYGVAAARRRQGHATRAVALMLEEARSDPAVRKMFAETNIDNLPSQRVLAVNGFARVGERDDPEDGRMQLWRLDL